MLAQRSPGLTERGTEKKRDPLSYYSSLHFLSQACLLSRIVKKRKPGTRRKDFAKIIHQPGQAEGLAGKVGEAVLVGRLMMCLVG